MEAEHSHPADGERSGRKQQPLSAESPTGSRPPQPQQPPSNPCPVHVGQGRLLHRKPKRSDLLLRLQHQHKTQAAAWQLSTDTMGPSGGSISSPSTSSLQSSSTQGHKTQGVQSQPSQVAPEDSPSKRGERKPQKPGKYVCTYCGRPCAKPSVLQKHIRSHTGERPYPCVPCGFSFKTKSNLYKHRKSHAHRIKAGLASSQDELSLSGPAMSAPGEDPEEPTEGESTDSEEESGQYRKERLSKQKSSSSLALLEQEEGQRSDNSQAVKQRLAMRLSERKRGPMASPEDPPSSSTSSSLGPSSKGSQESGYFSLSRSTEMSRADSQVSPPTAKTYAEIILGKYGRLGGQRGPHQQRAHSSSPGMEEKSSMPFSVPKTQVIEHITKLITINEAVVDTSEIDSVKPRRSSLSRKSSLELPKFSCPKDAYMFEPKGESPSPSMAGQSFFPHVQNVDPSGVQKSSSSVPLLRSHSMPTSAGQGNHSTTSPWGFCRLSHSVDEQQAVVAEMRVGGQHRLLRRQPAIEMPVGAELSLEEAGPSYTVTESGLTRKQQRKCPRLYECKACGVRCKQRESYEAHRGLCTGQPIKELERGEVDGACRDDRPQMMHNKFRALAMAVRKRRKAESLEEDPPSPGPTAVVTCSHAITTAVPSLVEQSEAFSGALSQAEQQQQQDRKGISVIQHTSSFEKQESMSMESQESMGLRESQSTLQKHPQPKSSPSMSRLVRQHNIQVPEILVTVEPDADMVSVSPTVTASSSKEPERVVEEFQWPQRSQSMAQLPAEKLPPKKKRLRLAEAAAQSSGESSFESVSLGPRSPSQESNISHSPSRSASFEDMGGKPAEPSPWGSSCTQGSHMLAVPSGPHQYQPQREMRRSASEQAPASPQHTDKVVETRSKSFDYGSLLPQQSASAWRERRKCLLVKHATLGEPDHEEGAVASHSGRPGSPKPSPSYTSHLALHPAEASTSRLSPEAIGKTVQLFHQPRIPPFPMQPTGHDRFPLGQIAQLHPVTTAISDVLSTHIIHRTFLHKHPSPPTIQVHPGQLHVAECLGLPLHPFSALLSLQNPTGAGETVYFPVSPGLTIQVPTQPPIPSTVVLPSPSPQSLVPLPCLYPPPVIATCLAQLTPVVSLVVPVRLQTHMTTYASALYTTLSQILASARSQEPICCMAMVIMGQLEQDKLQSSYLKIPTPDFKSYLPLSLPLELGSVSREGYGPLGAGGSKRMLSPAASLELSTEAQRQQKRVKEEEEKVGEEEENRGTGGEPEAGEDEEREPERAQIGVVTVKVEEEEKVQDPEGHREEREIQGKAEPKKEKGREENASQGVSASFVPQSPERAKAPSYTSLHTTTSVSWCYLNYVKPNPSAQRESQTSVYTSWSVSMHNPNLPGLSTKLALSLLSSKQKHSSETYTMATALTPATGKVVSASSRKTYISEVHAIPPSTPIEVKEPPQQPEKKGKREEQGPSTSKQSEPLRVQIFEGGYRSNEEYVYVRGRGRGKYVCGECGIRCKKPSMLRKHIRTHTDLRPYICKHCNFAFKTKGNLTKHMKSKAHGKKCQSMGTSGSSLDEPETEEAEGIEEHLSGSEDQDEHQFSDVDDSEEDDDEEEEESSSHDEPPSSCSSNCSLSARGHSSSGRQSQQGTPDPSAPEPQPDPSPCPSQELSPTCRLWPSGHAFSPKSRRALFSRRGWDASPRAFFPSSESCSPIRSLSPRRELASHNRHLSPSPKRGPSPIRALSPLNPMRPLSPLRPMSPSQYRVLWARASPSPLGVQHRPRSSPSHLPWDIPSMMASDRRQVGSMERIGTPSEGQIGPEPCLSFPPAFRLSPSDSPKAQSMDRVFSHLPLHSQQARVPYLMIPIGGIQMVQARPRSHPTTPTSTSSPPMEGLLLGQTRRETPRCRTPITQGL